MAPRSPKAQALTETHTGTYALTYTFRHAGARACTLHDMYTCTDIHMHIERETYTLNTYIYTHNTYIHTFVYVRVSTGVYLRYLILQICEACEIILFMIIEAPARIAATSCFLWLLLCFLLGLFPVSSLSFRVSIRA